MWLSILLAILGPLLQGLIESWLKKKNPEPLATWETKWMSLAAFGPFNKRRKVIAKALFDKAVLAVAQVPVGTVVNAAELVERAKGQVKAELA